MHLLFHYYDRDHLIERSSFLGTAESHKLPDLANKADGQTFRMVP